MGQLPPRCNRTEPICFSPYLYRARNLVERFYNRSSTAAGLRRAMTSSPPTTLPSFNSHRSGYGCAPMSPRPSHTARVVPRVMYVTSPLALWRRSYGIRYGRTGVRKRRAVMKFASFENVLLAATLVMFAVFLAWSVKIVIAWA